MSKYLPGDTVRVISWDEIKSIGIPYLQAYRLPSGIYFNPHMKAYCGREFIIDYITANNPDCSRYTLAGVDNWMFSDEMLTPVVEYTRISEMDYEALFARME